MTRSEKDQSINSEPHLSGGAFRPDESEDRAAKRLERDRASADALAERAKHSVFDEPAILPNRQPVLIERDWYCRNCTYNLRGLMTGSPCPECGVIERYEPPRAHEEHYAEWVNRQRATVRPLRGWLVVVACTLTAIPLAAFGSLLAVEASGVVVFVLFAPVVIEIAKVAAPAMVVERGTLFSRAAMIYVAAIGTAVVFGVVQNLICLQFVYANSPAERVAWRWTVCLLLHVVLSGVAAKGLAGAWRRSVQTQQPVALADSHRAMATAIVLHASINAVVLFGGFAGYGI